MITLITLTQGNPIALKRTIDNVVEWFDGKVNEVIVGDFCIFESDRVKMVQEQYSVYCAQYKMPFNWLFENGFAFILNALSERASNDLCLYMNVGEIVEKNIRLDLLNENWNCFKFNHATETHQWIRMWNRHQLEWSGRIHEEVIGQKYISPDCIFQMADTEKDNSDPFYSAVMNDIKELVYFNQYIKLVEYPHEQGATNSGWLTYARDSYHNIKERLEAKGARYEAFKDGNLQKYLDNCQEFEPQQNSDLIHFQ